MDARARGVRARAAMKFAGVRAVAAFVVALQLAPQEAFAQAEDVVPPGIVHEPCESYAPGKNYEIVARFYDESPIFDPKVVYRIRSKRWRSAPFRKVKGSEDFKAVIKRKALKGVLEYFIETFDENGNGPARYGSPEAPVQVKPARGAEKCVQVPAGAAEVAEADTAEDSEEAMEPVPAPMAPSSLEGSGTDHAADTGTGEGDDDDAEMEAELDDAMGDQTEVVVPGPPTETQPEGEALGAAALGAADGGQRLELGEKGPEPAATGCAAEDPPLYCSPVLWGIVGGVVAAGAAAGVSLYFVLGEQGSGPGAAGPVTHTGITITVQNPTGSSP